MGTDPCSETEDEMPCVVGGEREGGREGERRERECMQVHVQSKQSCYDHVSLWCFCGYTDILHGLVRLPFSQLLGAILCGSYTNVYMCMYIHCHNTHVLCM